MCSHQDTKTMHQHGKPRMELHIQTITIQKLGRRMVI